MSKEWKKMNGEQKAPYVKQCKEDKKRYNNDMVAYNQKIGKKDKRILKESSSEEEESPKQSDADDDEEDTIGLDVS